MKWIRRYLAEKEPRLKHFAEIVESLSERRRD